MRKSVAVLLLLLIKLPAAAEVNKIFYPTVVEGEREIEVRGFNAPHADPEQINKADVAYGLTPWWFSELEFEFEKAPGQSNHLNAIASENVMQLTEAGQYFADFGMFWEYERDELMAHDVVHKIVLGPIVSKEIGRWQGTANLFAEREFGPDAGTSSLKWNNAFQLKYRMHELFEPGAEYYAASDGQNLGPAVLSQFRWGTRQTLKTQFSYLWGLTRDAAPTTFRWMFEYEF